MFFFENVIPKGGLGDDWSVNSIQTRLRLIILEIFIGQKLIGM